MGGDVLEVTEMRLSDSKPLNRLWPHFYSSRALRQVSDRLRWSLLELTGLPNDLQRVILSFCDRTPSMSLLLDHFIKSESLAVKIPPPLVQRLTNRFRIILELPHKLKLGVCRFKWSQIDSYESLFDSDHSVRLHIRQMERKTPQWQLTFKCRDYSEQWGRGTRKCVDQKDMDACWIDVFQIQTAQIFTFTLDVRYLSKHTSKVVDLFSHTPYGQLCDELKRFDYRCDQSQLDLSSPPSHMRIFEQILLSS
jgi:hypothetical protein